MNVDTVMLMALALLGLAIVAALILLHTRRDPVTVLTILLLFLFLVNARWVLAPLGAIGSPALLVGLVAMCWWLAGVAAPSVGLAPGFQPVRWSVLGYAWLITVGYVIAHTRPLTDLQISSADRAMITLASMCGVALLAADGIATRDRLDTLLRRVVWLGGVFALIGILQFTISFDLVAVVDFPGLTLNRELSEMAVRSIFSRSASTALHSIEFSVVACILLPLAVHYGLHDPMRRRRRLAWVCAGLLGASIPMSVSRTGVLTAVVALAFMFAGWTWKQRLRGGVIVAVFTACLYVLIPGLLGTVRSLFMYTSSDPSITARVNRTPRAMELWSEHFWFGMGTSTFTLEDYFLVDVQYYVTAIEHGLVGVAALVALLVSGVWLATIPRRRGADPATANLGHALAAPLAAVLVALATFDALFYRIVTTLVFLFIGCAGALWRIERRQLAKPTVMRAPGERAARVLGSGREPHREMPPPVDAR